MLKRRVSVLLWCCWRAVFYRDPGSGGREDRRTNEPATAQNDDPKSPTGDMGVTTTPSPQGYGFDFRDVVFSR